MFSKGEHKNLWRMIEIGGCVILIILLFSGLNSCKNGKTGTEGSVKIDNRASVIKGSTSDYTDLLKDREVYFSGIEDTTINKATIVYLNNDENNDDIYLQYTVKDKDTEEVLFETDLIPSGQFVEWVPGDSGLHEGKNNILFIETPYIQIDEKWVTLTVGKNEAVFTLIN